MPVSRKRKKSKIKLFRNKQGKIEGEYITKESLTCQYNNCGKLAEFVDILAGNTETTVHPETARCKEHVGL